ncbi:hypothetical protein KEF29_23580 [Streptomyces tuirus]|uniref:Uncharacterized protein n=1 Tax=Streptomyces tuirus TaxID=68278 RepID=A0A941J0B7_9ACTN|nr:hypothetical protein [Streptomyces tuirus]
MNRRASVFKHSSPADINARLGEALDVLRARGAVDAYWAFNNDERVPNLGPAFFTKVLYFAGTTGAQRRTAWSSWTALSHELSRPTTLCTSAGRRTAGPRTNIGCMRTGCTSTRRPEASCRIKVEAALFS